VNNYKIITFICRKCYKIRSLGRHTYEQDVMSPIGQTVITINNIIFSISHLYYCTGSKIICLFIVLLCYCV